MTKKNPCRQGYACPLLFFTAILLLAGVGSASINLTVQSANLKNINAIRILDFSNVASMGNNQTATIPYDNYILNFGANASSVSWDNLFLNINGAWRDGTIIALIFLIIILSYVFVKGLEQ